MTSTPKKPRSPNYPALSLPQAVVVLQKLWKAEKRTPVNHDAASIAMGFKSLSGPARVAIGTLRQFGLIEKADKGHIRVSDAGIQIVMGDDSERRAALQRAAGTPELFQELAKTHGDASENAIQSCLLTKKGFAADGARKAAKAFRDTLALAKPDASGYTHTDEEEQPEIMSGIDQGQNRSQGAPTTEWVIPPMTWVLSVPRGVKAEVRLSGRDIRRDDLVRLKQQIDFLITSIDDSDSDK